MNVIELLSQTKTGNWPAAPTVSTPHELADAHRQLLMAAGEREGDERERFLIAADVLSDLAGWLPDCETDKAKTAVVLVFVHLLEGLRAPADDCAPFRLAFGWVRQVALEVNANHVDDEPLEGAV